MGGSGEKSPSKDMKFFFQLANLSQPVFLHENPTYWGLETAVCPIFVKPVLDIFAVCSLVPEFVPYATELFLYKKSKLLTREG